MHNSALTCSELRGGDTGRTRGRFDDARGLSTFCGCSRPVAPAVGDAGEGGDPADCIAAAAAGSSATARAPATAAAAVGEPGVGLVGHPRELRTLGGSCGSADSGTGHRLPGSADWEIMDIRRPPSSPPAPPPRLASMEVRVGLEGLGTGAPGGRCSAASSCRMRSWANRSGGAKTVA